ncbi:MAG: EamA family transporter [Micromonosporaceae bacterium]|nr:EamA family transporter [Micromonosporaceae bacterium]
MRDTWRWPLVTAVAPITWGSTYFVTQRFLPPEYPLYGSVLRALPAGLLLLAMSRALPRGAWWWRSAVLGLLNIGAFFALIYVAAQLLPSSVASTVAATSPIAMVLLGWALLRERPHVVTVAAAVIGALGVVLTAFTGPARLDLVGLGASLAAMLMAALGYVLTRKWTTAPGATTVNVLASTSWQLLAGALLLIPVAVAVEGGPPPLDARTLPAYAYLSLIATALAFTGWFTGLRHLSAGTVGIIGLLNPVTGVLLGTMAAGEHLSGRQVLGIVLVLLGVLAGQSLARPGLTWPRLPRLRARQRVG